MKIIASILAVLFILLQSRLWFGEASITEIKQLSAKIEERQEDIVRVKARNAALMSQINDLRGGTRLLEELAREDLGMLKPGETFIRVVD